MTANTLPHPVPDNADHLDVPESALDALVWRAENVGICDVGMFIWEDSNDISPDTGAPLRDGAGRDCYVLGGVELAAEYCGRELRIGFTWVANGDPATYLGMWDFRIERAEGTDAYPNFRVVDEDGDELDTDAIGDIIEACDIWPEVVAACLPAAPGPEDIDTDTEATGADDMETITIKRDNDADLRFAGEVVADASSVHEMRTGKSTGRWCELTLYRTRGGRYVCAQIGHTQWEGERKRHTAAVCDDEAAVIEFFGHGWLAKDLYKAAGIVDALDVE